MLLVLCLVVGIILGRINKKQVNININKLWMFIVGIIVSILGNVICNFGIDVLVYTQMISTIFILLFMLCNTKEIIVMFVGLGHTLNAIVMIANGSKMPVKVFKVVTDTIIDNRHFIINRDVNLYYLSDIIHLPYPFYIGNYVLSIGDMMIFAGVGVFIYKLLSKNLKASFKLLT